MEFDSAEYEILRILESERPKCSVCGKPIVTFATTPVIYDCTKDVCYECFVNDLKQNGATDEQLRELAEDYANPKEKGYGIERYDSRPTFLNDKDLKKFDDLVIEIKQKIAEEKEREIKDSFKKDALEMLLEAGFEYDELSPKFMNLLGILLRHIDDKFSAAYNHKSPGDIRFTI